MTPLRQVVSAVADSSGAATWTLGPVSPGYVWSGTLSLHAPGAAATPGAARSSATVGGVVWMSWYGSGPAGPVQAQGSETISVTTSGLTAGTLYTLSLIGEISTQSAATAVSPAAVTTSTSVTGSTVDISGGTIVVEQSSASNLQVGTNVVQIASIAAGNEPVTITGVPPWAKYLTAVTNASALSPGGTPFMASIAGANSLAYYAFDEPLGGQTDTQSSIDTYVLAGQSSFSVPYNPIMDPSFVFDMHALSSGGSAPTFTIYASDVELPTARPGLRVSHSDASGQIGPNSATQMLEVVDAVITILAGAAHLSVRNPGATSGVPILRVQSSSNASQVAVSAALKGPIRTAAGQTLEFTVEAGDADCSITFRVMSQ